MDYARIGGPPNRSIRIVEKRAAVRVHVNQTIDLGKVQPTAGFGLRGLGGINTVRRSVPDPAARIRA
jgi:hypothetical protein